MTLDVLIVDISLPDRSGLELIKDLHLLRPEMPVLAMSMHDEKWYAQRALKSGAKGYIMKNAPQKRTSVLYKLFGIKSGQSAYLYAPISLLLLCLHY